MLDSGFFMVPDAQWGFASSPVIHDGRVIMQADVQKGSFLAAFDVRTGKELWRTPREDVPTWSTPAVVSMNGRDQVIVNGWKHIGGYDLETGKEIWRMTGGGDIPVPTPIVAHGLVFITNAHGTMSPIYAIRADGDRRHLAQGRRDRERPHRVELSRATARYMQTPIVYGDILYVCRDNGVLSAFDAKTGDAPYQARLGDGTTGFTASPVAADGKHLLHERRRRRLRREGRARRSSCWPRTRSAKSHGDAGHLRRHAALPHPQSPRGRRRALDVGPVLRLQRVRRGVAGTRRVAPNQSRRYFPLPLSCGTIQVAVPVTSLPARSCAVTVS